MAVWSTDGPWLAAPRPSTLSSGPRTMPVRRAPDGMNLEGNFHWMGKGAGVGGVDSMRSYAPTAGGSRQFGGFRPHHLAAATR